MLQTRLPGLELKSYIKMEGKTNSLSCSTTLSPHVFVPSAGLRSTTSFYHQAASYYVEARARVIIFDMAAFEAENVLQRRPSSLVLHPDQSAKSLSREFGGLMSWPEHYFKAAPQDHNLGHKNEHPNNLSAKAMQLSIYGSMVPRVPSRRGNFQQIVQIKPSHSLSYPSVPLGDQERPLVSVRSEGSTRNRLEEELARSDLAPPSHSRHPSISHSRHPSVSHSRHQSVVKDESSDESGGEEDVIVRIDSPSRLSFRHAS